VPSRRRSNTPSVPEWDDPYQSSGPKRSSRPSLGSALASTFAALLALFLIPLSASVYYAMTTPDQYTGRALVQFRPRATDNGGVVGNETTASSAASYGAFLGTPSTVRSVAGEIGVPTAELRENMAVQLLPATTSLSITFSDGSPNVAAQGASALAQIAVQRAADDPLVAASVLAPASVPDIPSGPSKALIISAGAMFGLLLACATYYLTGAVRRSRAGRRPGGSVAERSSAAGERTPATKGADPALASAR